MSKEFSFQTLANCVQRNFIVEKHHDNIVYRWLKRPCAMYCSIKGILSQENIFYICFQFLDTLKSNDPSDCVFQDEIQCIPYEIERVFERHHYLDDLRQCGRDRFLTVLTLYTLLRLTGIPQTDQLAQYLISDMGILIPDGLYEDWYSDIYAQMSDLLTNSSPIYQQSAAIINNPTTSNMGFPYLVDYIQRYMNSPRRLSEEIAAQMTQCSENNPPAAQPSERANVSDTPKQETVETLLRQKDEEIAALKQELDTYQHPTTGSVQITNRCKSKVTALLSAMFYAGYFKGENGLSDRNQVVGHILQYGLHYPTKSIPQLLSAYMTMGTGNIEGLKEELREAYQRQFEDILNDLKDIQKT